MAFHPEHLITRQPVVDRNREIAFQRLAIAEPDLDTISPFMLRLANIEIPHAVYFVPIQWVQDAVLLNKLARDMVLLARPDELESTIGESARASGFRIALSLDEEPPQRPASHFVVTPWSHRLKATPDTLYLGLHTPEDAAQARATPAMYFSGNFLLQESTPVAGSKRINPSHALILEIMAAVQQEAEPKAIETLFKRDVTLSFKLLRYINSPWFGLVAQVESVRHALSIIGYQQLLKWLTLLVVTASKDSSPYLTQTAMVRAKLMELVGAKLLDKYDADNLFVTGMLSMLDRIMGVPFEEVLKNVNLPSNVTDVLINNEGRYSRFLQLAWACEGEPLPEEIELADIDTKAVNIAHLEAIEWATQAARTV